jgi:hypothetical protein
MRIRILALAILALLFAGGMVEADPLFFPLSEHTIAKSVSSGGMPLYRTATFCANDEQAFSWLLIFRDAEPHSVEWRWYYPQGRTYARSFSVVPPIDGFTGWWAAPVWSNMKIAGTDAARMPGMWKVDVIVDYRKVLTEYFTINGQQAC